MTDIIEDLLHGYPSPVRVRASEEIRTLRRRYNLLKMMIIEAGDHVGPAENTIMFKVLGEFDAETPTPEQFDAAVDKYLKEQP